MSAVFPDAEQRDDCFHVLYGMNKVRRKLKRRAYAAIECEGEALERLGKIRARDPTIAFVCAVPRRHSSAGANPAG